MTPAKAHCRSLTISRRPRNSVPTGSANAKKDSQLDSRSQSSRVGALQNPTTHPTPMSSSHPSRACPSRVRVIQERSSATARNVLNTINIVSLSPGGFPNPNINFAGDDYTIYYTQTGRAGGAYQQDVNGDNLPDWVPVHDPRVYGEGRDVRVGMNVTF